MLARVIVAIVLLLLPAAALAQAEKRIALLIGNRAYDATVGVLKNPHNDIAVVGEALAKQGFEVLPPVKDARRSAILRGVRELASRLNTAGAGAIGFLYYSGHGAAEKDTNINYLIPVDAKDPGTVTFWDESLKLDEILRLLDGARSAAKFIIFDACRNELQLPTKETTKGLLPVAEQYGMFIAYASAPGRTASDRGEKSGPYAEALAAELNKPGLDHLSLFQNVKEAVYAASGGAQQPWESNGLVRRVYLTGQPAPSAQPQAPALTRPSEAAEAWDRTKDTTSVSALEAFIGRFGDSYYGDLAKVRLAELKQAAEAAARKKADEEARAKAEAERQRLALLQKEEERKRAEAEEVRRKKADEEARAKAEAERQRLAMLQREEERKRAEIEKARREAELQSEWNECMSGVDERQIPGCTALITRADLSSQNKSMAFSNRCNTYVNLADQVRAMADCNEAVSLNSENPYAYLNRGRAYSLSRDRERAIADLDRAISLNPRLFIAYIFRGLAYEAKGNRTKAISDYQYALSNGTGIHPSNLEHARNGLQRLGVKPPS